MSGCLFERLGGRDAVKATVVRFYEKILEDELLIPFFEDVDMARLRASQTAFITMAFGGPHHYEGQHLRTAHFGLVKRGLSDVHFDRVAGHLVATLQELGVDAPMIDEALAIVATTRDDVLNR
jgi:hemoglobin